MLECIQFNDVWNLVKSNFNDTTSPKQKIDTVLKQYQSQLEHIKVTDKAIDELTVSIYNSLINRLKIRPSKAKDVGLTKEYVKETILQKESLLEEAPKENESNVKDMGVSQSSTALRNAINDVFGTYDTAGDIRNEFIENFTRTVIWDPETGKSPNSKEELNSAIRDLQQSMYEDVSQYLLTQGHDIPEKLFNSDGSNNFGELYKPMEVVLGNITPLGIKHLKLSNSEQESLKLQAIKSYFHLKFFDSFVLNNYKDSFQLKSPSFSGRLTTEDKYEFNAKTDQKQADDWFNVDKRSPKDIMSKRIQSLFSLIPHLRNGVEIGKLDTKKINAACRELRNNLLLGKGKAARIIENFVIQDYGLTEQEKLFLQERFGAINQETGQVEIIRDKVNLEQLLAVTRYNLIDGYSILYKVLSKGKNLKRVGLSLESEEVINSLSRYIFDSENNPNALKQSDRQLYEEVVHTFDYTSYIPTSKYSENENGLWEINEMSPINEKAIEGQYKEQINSLYDPISVDALTRKYKITENFDEQTPDHVNSFIQFEINNSDPNLNSYLVTVYTHQNNSRKNKVIIQRKLKDFPDRYVTVTRYQQNDFNSLLRFIKDTLGEHLGRDKAFTEQLIQDANAATRDAALDKILKKIMPLASTTLAIGKLMRSFNSDGSTPLKEDYQAKGQDWGLILFSKDNKAPQKVRYYSGYEGYDVIHTDYLEYIKTMARSRAIVNEAYSRSVMRTSEGTNIPVDKLAHVNADRRTAIVGQIETEHSALKIGNNKYITDDIASWSTSREAKTASGGKQNVSFNFNECLFSAFCLDFLTGYMRGNKRYFQFTEATVSDKPNVPKISVLMNPNTTTEEFRKLIQDDFGKLYLNIWKNIKSDFDTLQEFIQTNPIEYKGVVIDSSLVLDYNTNFSQFNSWVKTNIPKDLNLSGQQILNKICLEYNKKHRFNPIEINENVHKRNGSNGIELNYGFMSELMRFNRDSNMNLHKDLQDLKGLSDQWATNSYWWNQQNSENYFNKNDLRLVDNLISNRAYINIKHDSGNDKKQTWATKLGNLKGWHKDNGEVVFARIFLKDGSEVKVSNSYDLAGYTNKNGEFIEFVDGNGNGYTSDDARFNFETLNSVKNKNNILRIEVNPLLRKWNVADFYYSNKSTAGTTGLYFWCDAKKAKNTNYEVENAQNDFQKRNVTQTATMNQFMQGSLLGMASKANMAIFKQPSTTVNNVLGDSGSIDYWDGGTYTDAFQHYWENGSLCGAVTGFTKKPIMHFYNERFALAQLDKTAAFAITNHIMRRSLFHRKLHYKASKGTWLNKDGKQISQTINVQDNDGNLWYFKRDASKDTEINGQKYYGWTRPISGEREFYVYTTTEDADYQSDVFTINNDVANNYAKVTENVTADISKYYTWDNDTQKYVANEMNYSDCYYQKDGSYYQIDRIVRLSDTKDPRTGKLLTNMYDVYINQVDIRGNKLAGEPTLKFTRKINSNYRLWEVLGGTGSVELDEYTGRFKESENSIKKVSQVACRVGQRLIHSGEATSQSGIFQFMKHSDIHYIVTDGAFKKAPGNLNTFEQLTNNEDLNFMRVNMNYSGIQLDPTHQADNSTVSLMTQVMSALADRGYTKELANQVYSALGEITRESIEPFFDAYRMLLQTNSKDSIVDLISKQIVDSFKGSKITSDNMLQTISLNLYNLIQSKSGGKVTSKDLEGLVPWSENSVSTLINSTVTSTINKLGIRLKTFGSLSVLNPSHGTIQLYGDRQLPEYTSAYDFYSNGVKMWDNKITDHSFRFGRWYRYNDGQGIKNIQITLDTYYDFIKNVDEGKYTDISETYLGQETTVLEDDIIKGDVNLSEPYFGLVKYYRTKEDAENGVARYEFSESQLKRTYVEGNTTKKMYKIVTVDLLGRDLDTYNVFMNNGKYNVFDLKSVHDKRQLHLNQTRNKKRIKELNNKIRTFGEEEELKQLNEEVSNYSQKIHQLNRQIQRDFENIVNKKAVQIYDAKTDRIITTDITDHETSAYGILMPMIYKLKFGLREGDSLYEIRNDPDFFFRRLLQEYYDLDLGKRVVSKKNYDIILRRSGGKNIYLKLKDKNPIDSKSLKELFINKSRDQNGTLWREDGERNALHKMYSESDVIYQDISNRNKGEVIFTDAEGIKFYIDNYRNDIFDVQVNNSKDIPKEHLDNLEKAIKESKYGVENFGEKFKINWLMFDHTDAISKFAINGLSLEEAGLADLVKYNSKDYKLKTLYKHAQRMHVAFKESLKTLAARIPSQGMASFMSMKVEGFTGLDVNDCFVSDMQIWLQGSDFDVDKVTLMGCSFTNSGRYIKWSRHMIDDTSKALDITSNLKFPTGRKTTVIDGENSLEEYKDLFKNNKLNIRNEDGSYDYDNLELLVNMINRFDKQLVGKAGELRDNIQRVVDEHNLTDFKEYKQEALSNLIQHVSIKVSESLLNAVASQQSTDDVAEPLKELASQSAFGTKDIQNRYGNASVKIIQMISNQTGKSGIAVTASVGIKAFFAITQYFNTKLAEAKTPEEIAKYKFDVKIDDKTYNTIANVRVSDKVLKDWLNSDNTDLQEMAQSIIKNDQIDADLTISGIMTLAVDNAKLLDLSKLNASTDILGLYLYGVTIGVPFDNLVKIFTSNVADVLNQNLRGNIFNGSEDVRLGFAISKLKNGPYISKKVLNNELSEVNKKLLKKDKDNPYTSISDMFLGENGIINAAASLYSNKEDPMIYAKRRFFIIREFNKVKERLKDLYKSKNQYDKRLVNNVLEYMDQLYRIYGNGRIEDANKTLADIETLYEGKKELSNLKNMILNQGIKVLENEQLSWIDTFSNTIKSRLGKGGVTSEVTYFKSLNENNSARIDILKYAIDDEYRKAAIEAYGSVKHTINILDVIDTLPHFREYLKGYAASNIAKLNSSKYEAKSKVADMLFETYGAKVLKDKENILKRVDSFLTGIMYDEFLKSSNVPTIQIEAGSTIISSTGVPITLDSATNISLGTDLGNMNFKLWVENTVLPNLQNTYKYSSNQFINDLTPRRYKFTQFGNLVRGLALPIDMIPKSDSDQLRLDMYKYAFGELSDMYKSSGLTIQEIFYIYNMLTYQNKQNTRALTPITDTLYNVKNSIAFKASKFISDFDKNVQLITGDVYSKIGDISPYFTKQDLIQAVAPSTREINLKYFEGPYLRMFNYKTLQWELLKRKKTAEENDEAARHRLSEEGEYDDEMADEIEEMRRDEIMNNDGDVDSDNEHWDENSTGDETEEQTSKKTDIYENYERINTVSEIGMVRRILETLGKLPRDQYFTNEFLFYNSYGVSLIDTPTTKVSADINNDGTVRVLHTKIDSNKITNEEFYVEPMTEKRFINDEQVDTIDRTDLMVKINKKINPCK